jgi:hypothetical protein
MYTVSRWKTLHNPTPEHLEQLCITTAGHSPAVMVDFSRSAAAERLKPTTAEGNTQQGRNYLTALNYVCAHKN